MGGRPLAGLWLLALLPCAVSQDVDSVDNIAACNAHPFCPQIPNITCCPNRQGEFLPCCTSTRNDMSLCTAHPKCPDFPGVSCCPDVQGEFLPCCSASTDIEEEQVPTNAAEGSPAALPASETRCSAHVASGCPDVSDENCCPNGMGVFLPCCTGTAATPATSGAQAEPTVQTTPGVAVPAQVSSTAAALPGAVAPPATTVAVLTAAPPTTTLPTVLPSSMPAAAAAATEPPQAASDVVTGEDTVTTTSTTDEVVGLYNKFVSKGGAYIYWVSPEGTKHEVYSSSDCVYCGCSGTVLQSSRDLVNSIPTGETFSCAMVLGERGRFITFPGNSSVFWQEPSGHQRHMVPENVNCAKCGCGGKIETLSEEFVMSIPEGSEFSCDVMPSEVRRAETPSWMWLLLVPVLLLCVGPLTLLCYNRRTGKRATKTVVVDEGDHDEEANAPLIGHCTCSRDNIQEYEEDVGTDAEESEDVVEIDDSQQAYGPGTYRIVVRASVTAGLPRDSREVAMLEVGQTIQVTEVVQVPSEQRIRGRAVEPAGWVSLYNDELGFPWAEMVSGPQK